MPILYRTNDLKWLNFNGGEIMLQTSKEGILFKVKESDVFPSISCAINIGLTLYADTQLDSIGVGGWVKLI